MIDPARIQAFDFETKGVRSLFGLQPWRAVTGEAWPTTCAMAWWQDGKIDAAGHVRPTVEMLAAWLDEMIAAGFYVVCWNAPFDVAWLLALAKLHNLPQMREAIYKIRWLDGLLLYRHVINTPRFKPEGRVSLSLKPAVAKFLPRFAGYEDDIDYNDESPENIAKLLRYNRRDSAFTLALTAHFLSQVNERQQRCALIEARCIPDVAEANLEGIRLNPEACKILGEKLEEQRRLAFMTLKLKHPQVSEEILASPSQLADLMFNTWGLPVVELTDTGNASTNKRTLIELALQDDRARLVHEYRDANYCKAKFSTSPQESLAYNEGEFSHPIARVFGTYTSRMTYSSKTGKGVAEVPTGVALHQWKRDPDYRKLILPPEGYDLIEFDVAGQEFKWMAVESGDPQMLQLCMPGEDPHAFMGARINGLDYRWLQTHAGDDTSPHYKEAKPKRQLGKVGNLSLQYRTSAGTLVTVAAVQHKVKLSPVEAKAIWSTYRTTYRKVPDYWKRQIKQAKALGYVTTLAGRKLELGMPDTWVWVDENGVRQDWTWGHESAAINFPIQGVGGDQKYLGILCMRDLCTRYDARFYYELHDGIFYIAPKDRSEKFAHEGKALLSNLPYDKAWGVKLPIKFPVDGKRGPSWGELKEFH